MRALLILCAAALFFLYLFGPLTGSVTTPVKAQDGPDAVLIEQIARFLRLRLSKPIPTLDNYSYEAQTYPDSALGCPENDKTYTPGPFAAFKLSVTLDGTLYDVRATRDGAQIVLCSGAEIKQQVGLATFRNRQFSISYPNTWGTTDRLSDIFFGLGPGPVCAQPGMIVMPLGASGNRTPDSLLDEYARAFPNVKFEGERISIRGIGRSAVYVAPCADGSPRQQRVTMFVAYGQAFRVNQFAPQASFGQWADVYLNILNDFGPTVVGGGEGGQPMRLPATSPLAAIVHIFGGNVYAGALTDLPGRPITRGAAADRAFRDVQVSPDGQWVSFVDPNQRALFVAPLQSEGDPQRIAEGLADEYPAAWSADSSQIAYMVMGDAGFAIAAIRVDGSDSRKIGDAVGVAAQCPPVSDPSERLYRAETGPDGNRLLLEWPDADTLYYSANCGADVARMKGGTAEVVFGGLRRARLSPDHKLLIGLMGTDLIRISLEDGQAVKLTPQTAPDQLAWSLDSGVIYYAAAEPKTEQVVDNEADKARAESVFGAFPFRARVYAASLHRLDLFTGEDIELYRGEGRGIGRIMPAPDGSGVLFSFVQSDAALVEAFNNNVSSGELRRVWPATQLYWLPLPVVVGNAPQWVAVSTAPTWGPAGSALAPTPTAGPRQAKSPTRLPAVKLTATPTRTPTAAPSPTPGATATRPKRGTPPPTNTPRPTATPNTSGRTSG